MRNMLIAVILLVFVVVPFAVMKYGDNTQDNYKQAAYLANGLSMAGPVKTYIMEYFSSSGKFPVDNSLVGLPEPERFSDNTVRSVAIQDGVIVITYTEKTGVDGGIIRLTPEPDDMGYMMKWHCESPSYPNINNYMPQCRYIE